MLKCSLLRLTLPQGNVATGRLGTRPPPPSPSVGLYHNLTRFHFHLSPWTSSVTSIDQATGRDLILVRVSLRAYSGYDLDDEGRDAIEPGVYCEISTSGTSVTERNSSGSWKIKTGINMCQCEWCMSSSRHWNGRVGGPWCTKWREPRRRQTCPLLKYRLVSMRGM